MTFPASNRIIVEQRVWRGTEEVVEGSNGQVEVDGQLAPPPTCLRLPHLRGQLDRRGPSPQVTPQALRGQGTGGMVYLHPQSTILHLTPSHHRDPMPPQCPQFLSQSLYTSLW